MTDSPISRLDHDPQVNPQYGDILEKDSYFRHVSSNRGGWVRYNCRCGDQWLNSIMSCTNAEWSEWAAGAEIVTRGDE